MGFVANVLRVMIVSPSDVPDARDAVESALHGWNDPNAEPKQTILLPWRWETSAVPQLTGTDGPQSLINRQGVDRSDIIFALFGSRLGSPTPDAVSGTVEEIQLAREQGKPVHCYFSTAPLPNDVDVDQLTGLRQLRGELQKLGLLGEFSTVSQLEYEVWKAIEYDLGELGKSTPVLSRRSGGVELVVQPGQERELRGHTKQGRPQYNTRHWLDVTNNGSVDAEDLRMEWIGEVGAAPLEVGPTTIHASQTRRFGILLLGGGGEPPVVRVTWTEDGESRERDFHV